MLAKRVAYNTLVQIGGKIVGFLISGISLVLIAEHLGTYNMGNYVTIVAFVGFFVTLSDLGANLLMVRDISQNEVERERITGEYFGFRLTVGLVILALAPIIASLVPQYDDLIVKGAIIATITQFILLVNQMFISMLQTQLLLDRAVLAELINRAITLALLFYVISLNLSGPQFFFAVLYVTLIGSVANLLVTFSFARRLWPVRPRISLDSWRRMMVLIAPMGIFSFLGMVHFKADTILLSLLKTPTEVGIYGYAYKIGEILFTFPTMFMGAIFPRLSQLLTGDRPAFLRFAQTAFDAILIGSVPFLTFVFIGANYFTLLLSRTSVEDGLMAGTVLQILTVAMIGWFIGTYFIHVLIMANDYKGLIRNLALAVVVNVVLNLVLIPRYSVIGAAWATVITELLMLLLTARYTSSNIGLVPRLGYLGKVLLATAVMAIGLWFIIQLPGADYALFATDSRLYQMTFISLLALSGAAIFAAVFWPLGGRQFLASFRRHDG